MIFYGYTHEYRFTELTMESKKNQWSWNYLLHIRKTRPLQGTKGQTCWCNKLNNSIMASSDGKHNTTVACKAVQLFSFVEESN